MAIHLFLLIACMVAACGAAPSPLESENGAYPHPSFVVNEHYVPHLKKTSYDDDASYNHHQGGAY